MRPLYVDLTSKLKPHKDEFSKTKETFIEKVTLEIKPLSDSFWNI